MDSCTHTLVPSPLCALCVRSLFGWLFLLSSIPQSIKINNRKSRKNCREKRRKAGKQSTKEFRLHNAFFPFRNSAVRRTRECSSLLVVHTMYFLSTFVRAIFFFLYSKPRQFLNIYTLILAYVYLFFSVCNVYFWLPFFFSRSVFWCCARVQCRSIPYACT